MAHEHPTGPRPMTRPLPRWLIAGLLLIGAFAPDAPALARPASASASPALWQVKDADTTIYLFGTVHVMKPGIDWFRGGIRQAFDRSDELVVEIVEPDDPQAMGQTMATKALSRDGTRLSDRLEPTAREKYLAAMAANGLPAETFEMFDPWMAGMILSVAPLERLGYRNDLGAEKTLTAAAKAAGKPVDALETVEQQIDFFANLPIPQQVAFLNATVDGLPDLEGEFASLLDSWRTGQPEKLAAEMNESLKATPELAKVLLLQRNANWARWIKARMDKPGTVFIAVGAGHLAGDGSVQAQLDAIGLRAKRVSK